MMSDAKETPGFDDATYELAPAEPSSSSGVQGSDSGPRVGLVAGSWPRLTGETQSLLRSRLKIATLILLVPMTFFILRNQLKSFEDLPQSNLTTVYQYFVLAALTGAAIALWSPWELSLAELRALELVVFGLPSVLFLFLHLNLLDQVHANVHARGLDSVDARDALRLAVYLIINMWFAVVVIYGTFIPNRTQRAAVVMGAMTLVPISVLIDKAVESPELRGFILPDLLSVTVATMSVAYATALYGSYKISSLRREAFQARQLGQYRLTRCLGTGGMGEVFLAEHQMLKRPCAIKLIRPGQASASRAVARFEREVRAISRLTHWNSVEIFDYGRADDGTFYYAMEYLPGLTLQDLVQRQGPLQPERAVHLLRQVSQALAEAHTMGIIHRDIKPSNIIASRRGGICDVAKLLDFGLALLHDDRQEMQLTQEGAVAGSPFYMAPECIIGVGEPDTRCDIYSLGAVAYYLLTGKPPFRGETPLQVMIAHARESLVPPREWNPSIPVDLQEIVLRCLAKEPDARFANAAALEQALASCACADGWSSDLAARWWVDRLETEAASDTAHDTVPTAIAT